ncbi:MAG: hypothetical protein OEY28_09060, partial [Nitrospira sp.]|nr:hypothetical protein [Nitrospira sp.]
ARALMSGAPGQGAQQALAATVLKGRADTDDLAAALGKIRLARSQDALSLRFVALFEGCSELGEAGVKAFVTGLMHRDREDRRLYLRALRVCGDDLKLEVCRKVLSRLDEENKADEENVSTQVREIRIELSGILAGAGDNVAVSVISAGLESEVVEVSQAAGAALVDATPPGEIFAALKRLPATEGVIHSTEAMIAGYREICLRGIERADGEMFRAAFRRAMSIRTNNYWRVQSEFMPLQQRFQRAQSASEIDGPMPPDLIITRSEAKLE